MQSDHEFHGGEMPDDWETCPKGALTHMVRQLNVHQQRTRMKQLLGAATLSMVLIAGGVIALGSWLGPANPQKEFKYGGIFCSECCSHFAAYHDYLADGKTSMDATLVKSMAVHLAQCGRCRKQFNTRYPEVAINEASVATWSPLRSVLPLFAVGMDPAIY